MEMRYFHDGAPRLRLDRDRCAGCGRCVDVCPRGVFTLRRGASAAAGSRPAAEVVRPEYCMECGACKRNCPAGAIEVESGVGCAAAIIGGMLRKKAPECGCSGSGKGGVCCG